MREDSENILRTQADSWFVGANIPGKARVLLTAPDTAPVMRAKRAEVAGQRLRGFHAGLTCRRSGIVRSRIVRI